MISCLHAPPRLGVLFALSGLAACSSSSASAVPLADAAVSIEASAFMESSIESSMDSSVDSGATLLDASTPLRPDAPTTLRADASADVHVTPARTSPFALQDDAFVLRSIHTGAPVDDLAPLAQIVGDATYVALGENIHTSGGQHAIRSRMVRYLVEQLGFRAVALETPYGNALMTQRFVEACEGTAASSLNGIFGVFASVEMRDDLQWLCDWNRTHPSDRVAFFGYDIQNPYYDGAFLRSALPTLSPAYAAMLQADIDQCIGATATYATYTRDYDTLARTTAERHRACLAGLDSALIELHAGTHSLTDAARAAISIAIKSLRAHEDFGYHNVFAGSNGVPYGVEPDLVRWYEARDRGMADTLVAMRNLYAPGKRVAVIAHNGHISENQDLLEVAAYEGIRSMGTFLARGISTSDGYRAIGISSFETFVNWPGSGMSSDTALLADAADSMELATHATDQVGLLIDLKSTASPTTFPRNRALTFGTTTPIAERGVWEEQYHAVVLLKTSHGMTFGYAP